MLALLEDDIHGIIIGEGPERGYLEDLIVELSLEDRISLAGNVDEERKFQYLSAADVFVLSSVHEGFGIVIQEAMQTGITIVATNNGGQTDLITNGENGYLVPIENPHALAYAVQHALSKGKKVVEDQVALFSPKNIAHRYIDLID